MMPLLKSSCHPLADKLHEMFGRADKEILFNKRLTMQRTTFFVQTLFSAGHVISLLSLAQCLAAPLSFSIKQTVNHSHHVFYVVICHIAACSDTVEL